MSKTTRNYGHFNHCRRYLFDSVPEPIFGLWGFFATFWRARYGHFRHTPYVRLLLVACMVILTMQPGASPFRSDGRGIAISQHLVAVCLMVAWLGL
ncbi:hypothetical protein S518_001435 [Salmonella enterica subsp. enterica]|nr:hypothetical protein [Salmonella enterica subsp. enterica]